MIKISDEKLDLILKELRGMKQEMKQEQRVMKQVFTEKLEIVGQKLDRILEQVEINAENIAVMQGDLNQLKDLEEKIVKIQERQDRTIDILKKQSINQKTGLRTINQVH